MNLKIRVVAHTIPNTLGVAIPTMVMLTIEQSVLVGNGLIQTQQRLTMRTMDIPNIFLFPIHSFHDFGNPITRVNTHYEPDDMS